MIALLFVFSLGASPTAIAADAKKTKGIPANPPKKKIKGIPSQKKADTGELTDDEKATIAAISKTKALTPTIDREKVALPPQVLAARAPVVPETRAPQPPSLPLGDPNIILRNIPQAPANIPQPQAIKKSVGIRAPTDPTKKKR